MYPHSTVSIIVEILQRVKSSQNDDAIRLVYLRSTNYRMLMFWLDFTSNHLHMTTRRSRPT